ncbi:MAG: guanylate kinase [Chloroflexi bacterium]|nr:guanylate kinase [Chloroflexota bacterium]
MGRQPLLIVLSGPSGVGKDAVLSRMKELGRPYHFTVTSTTRPRRSNERDGVDYVFVSADEFRRMIARGELLEWAEVYGNYYGVPKSHVVQALDSGHDVIIKADVQGAASIKKLAPEALFIFLAPPSRKELERRLSHRMTESPEALRLRLETAEREMEAASQFDHVVVNHKGRLDAAVEEIERIIERERTRCPPRKIVL